MKFLVCAVVAGLLFFRSQAKEKIFAMEAENTPVKILGYNKQTLIIGSKYISLLNKDKTVTVIEQPAAISDATVNGDELWLGTDKGIKIYDLRDYKLIQTYFPSTRISSVAVDAYKRVWVATTLKGVFMQDGDSFIKKVNIPGVYTLVCTADSNIWVGTNVGLYRIAGADFKTTRYAEEGYSGYELPDNIVEHLYKDEQSNVWVIMPDNISFKSNAKYQGEIPSYAYVGDKNNQVKTIVPVAGSSYIFITEKGIFFLPSASLNEEHHTHGNEVFAADNAQAFAVDLKQLNTPENLSGYPVTYAEKVGENVYFITAGGGWKVKEKELIKHITKR